MDSIFLKLYVCTCDLRIEDFENGVRDFLQNTNKKKLCWTFSSWYESGCFYTDFPFRFGVMRFFIPIHNIESLYKISSQDIKFYYDTQSEYVSQLQQRTSFPDFITIEIVAH